MITAYIKKTMAVGTVLQGEDNGKYRLNSDIQKQNQGNKDA